jgi:hypothetical protein
MIVDKSSMPPKKTKYISIVPVIRVLRIEADNLSIL